MRRAKTLKAILAGSALALAVTGAQAGWQDKATAFDADRFGKLEESKSKALHEAENGGRGRDLAVIHEVLDPTASSRGSLVGQWRCRTIKLGGMSPDKIYAWSSCRIAGRGEHMSFVKLNGAQRTRGDLYPNESGGLVYLGASSAKGESMHRYSGGGNSIGAQATPDDQIGLLVSTGRDSARLELPYPVQESTFEVIELKR
jgi:uncharacterized protein DUF4893